MWRCAHTLYQSLDHGCSCVRCHASGKHVLMCVERRGGVGIITNHNGLGEEEKRKEEEKRIREISCRSNRFEDTVYLGETRSGYKKKPQ